MPPWVEDKEVSLHAGQIWREMYIHYGTEDNKYSFACPVRCPEKVEETDPICAHVKGLYATKNPEDAELAKELRAKQRLFSSVVDLDDQVYTDRDVSNWVELRGDQPFPFKVGDTKIQLYSYGYTVFNQLLDILTDGVDISDLNKGFDVFLTRKGKGKQDTEYNLRLNPQGPTSFKFVGNITELNPNLDLLMPFADLERMQNVLTGAGNSPQLTDGSTEDSAQAVTPKYAPRIAAPKKSVNVDDLYAELKQAAEAE
jgi:hypothetical protein